MYVTLHLRNYNTYFYISAALYGSGFMSLLPAASSHPMSSSTTVVRPTTSPSLGSGSGDGTSSLPTDPTEPSGTNTLVSFTFSIILVITIVLVIF